MSNKTFSDGLVTPEGTTRFHTTMFFTASPQGNGWTGFCDLLFFTPDDQPNYATMLSPEGVQSLASNLMSVLAAQPKPPTVQWHQLGGRIQGDIPPSPSTKTYFGQSYETDVIQALGVLTIRANIVDQALIDLTSELTGMPLTQASAQYYSSSNMKARLDSIRAISAASELPDLAKNQINGALDRLKKAADRRNDIVHGRWTFRKGKHRLELIKPNAKEKRSEITVTERHVLDIAEAYSTATALLLGSITAVRTHRSA